MRLKCDRCDSTVKHLEETNERLGYALLRESATIKMLEEMANYVDCLKEGYYLKCNCGACKTLDKYRKFKEGLK